MRTTTTLLFFAAMLGCSDDSTNEPGDMCKMSTSADCMEAPNHSDLAWIETNVFAKQCAFSGCHGTNNPNPAANRVRSPEDSVSDLVRRSAIGSQHST